MIERPEERVVLLCARSGDVSPHVRAELEGLLRGPLNWDAALNAATEQSVLPLVHRTLSNHFSALPPEVRQQADLRVRLIVAESLRLTSELVEALTALRDAGVSAIPFKGTTLALAAYGDIGARAFSDIDLLVRPAELATARQTLLDLGYTAAYPTKAPRALLLRHATHEGLSRGDTLIELHWRVANKPSQFGLDYEALWARVQHGSVAGLDVSYLPPVDLLILLCIHGNKHAWERLSWICDVAELLRSEAGLSGEEVLAGADQAQCRRVVLLGMLLAKELLDAQLPEAVEHTIRADPTLPGLVQEVRRRLFKPPSWSAGTLGFQLATREGLSAKLRFASESLTALNQTDLQNNSFGAPFTSLYYVARAVRLLRKSVGHALSRRRSVLES
jgi:hypothetical protein